MATVAPTLPRLGMPAALAGAQSDAALARMVGQGDQRAFELLYQRYRDQLHRYCASQLRQREDAEEALQATMLNAYRWLSSGVRELQVRPWLYRIAYNECINVLRRRTDHEPLMDDGLPDGTEVDERAELKEGLRQLWADLNALPLPQRSALVLRELSGLTHDEIGRCLDAPSGVAKQWIYEARQSLQEFGQGRELACVDVRRRLSDGDGRVLKARKVGAHLRACSGCREFRTSLRARRRKLMALFPPLPMLAAERIIVAILGSGGSGGAIAGGAALVGSAPAGVAALVLKAAPLAAVAIVGGAGVPAALEDRPVPVRPPKVVSYSAAAPAALPHWTGTAPAVRHQVVSYTPGPRATAPARRAGGTTRRAPAVEISEPTPSVPVPAAPVAGPPAPPTPPAAPSPPAAPPAPATAAEAVPSLADQLQELLKNVAAMRGTNPVTTQTGGGQTTTTSAGTGWDAAVAKALADMAAQQAAWSKLAASARTGSSTSSTGSSTTTTSSTSSTSSSTWASTDWTKMMDWTTWVGGTSKTGSTTSSSSSSSSTSTSSTTTTASSSQPAPPPPTSTTSTTSQPTAAPPPPPPTTTTTSSTEPAPPPPTSTTSQPTAEAPPPATSQPAPAGGTAPSSTASTDPATQPPATTPTSANWMDPSYWVPSVPSWPY